jgi:non-canonical poly(A) RNA polymerase PAPD5/7
MIDCTLANDISRGSYNISKVRQTLRGAYEIMTSSAYALAGILRARQTGRYSNHIPPEEMSILSKIVGITQEVTIYQDDSKFLLI